MYMSHCDDPNPIPTSPTFHDSHNTGSNGFMDDISIGRLPDFPFDHHHLGFADSLIMPPADPVAPQLDAAAWVDGAAIEQGYVDPSIPQPAPDLLNLLQLPRCTVGSTNIWGAADDVSVLHLGYPAAAGPPPAAAAAAAMGGDWFRALPQLFCGGEEREGVLFQDVEGRGFEHHGGAMEYRSRELAKGGEVKGNFATEKQRRVQLNQKYNELRSLVPNPTKSDRASVVGDAIDYIDELKRTINELKLLVEKRKHGKERRKMLNADEDAAGDMESSSMRPPRDDPDRLFDGALRSSWLQRRSKEGFVDVRIVEDEVNIKLHQKKKPNCLLHVAKVLDELQLDLVHVAGGNIGDSYIFMFNSKICEGSSVYAGAIAKKLVEAMERQCQTQGYPAGY